MTHLQTLQKYYDAPTLRAWISRYESSENELQKEQVTRWRWVLAELSACEKVEPSPIAPQPSPTLQTHINFDDYPKNA